MRLSHLGLAVLVVAAPSVVACASDDGGGPPSLDHHADSAPTAAPPSGDANGSVAANAASDPPACSGVAEAKSIAADKDAGDLQLVDGAVFYRTGTKVMRAPKDGGPAAPLYDSANLVRAFVIGGGVVAAIESPDPPNAVLELVSADETTPVQAVATDWNAGGSYVFGADAQSLYAVADVPNGGEVVYTMPLAQIAAMTAIAQADDVISSAQLTDDAVWYVRDRNRVFSIPAPDGTTTPKEVFGVSTACALAVGTESAFCSEGAMLEQRDLSGESPKTLLEAAKSKVTSPFGKAVWSDGTLYVASSAADAKDAYTIRAITPSAGAVDERIVACGRGTIGDIAVDKENVAWTESEKGVFLAPR